MLRINSLYILMSIFCLLSCNSDDTVISNNQVGFDYFFEIEFCGEVHRIEGNSNDIDTNSASWFAGDVAYGQPVGVDAGIILRLNDTGSPLYVSGSPIGLSITTELNVGIIDSELIFMPSNFTSDCANSNGILPTMGFYEGGPILSTDVDFDINMVNKIPLQVTDTGSAPIAASCFPQPICFGAPIKGEYEGILYFASESNILSYDVELPIRIDFAAIRI